MISRWVWKGLGILVFELRVFSNRTGKKIGKMAQRDVPEKPWAARA